MRQKKIFSFGLLVVFLGVAALGLQGCAPATVSTSPNAGTQAPSDAGPDD